MTCKDSNFILFYAKRTVLKIYKVQLCLKTETY